VIFLFSRNLKLGAFHRVDELQALVYDYGAPITHNAQSVRAHTALGTMNNGVNSSCKFQLIDGSMRMSDIYIVYYRKW